MAIAARNALPPQPFVVCFDVCAPLYTVHRAMRRDRAAAAALQRIPIPDVAGILARGAVSVVVHHPVKIGLNFLGLLLLFAATGYTPSPAAVARFEDALPSRELLSREREAQHAMLDARAAHHASRSWLGWSCDAACARLRDAADARAAEWSALAAAQADAVTRAKAELGLFSAAGISEARDQFWASFAGGTAYAKRATMWDALFVGMRSMGRDEPLLNFALQMLFRVISNLTVGIGAGVVQFFWIVVGIARSFRPSWLEFLLFLAAAGLAGISFFVSSVVAMLSVGALTVAGAASALRLVQDAQHDGRQQQQEQRRMRAHED